MPLSLILLHCLVRLLPQAGGSNTQILYNSSGTATGSANMTFDGTRPTFASLRTNSILPSGGLPSGAFGGGIIQIVETKSNTQVSYSGSGSWRDVLSLSITPRSSSNKILLMAMITAAYGNGRPEAGCRFLRNSTAVYVTSGTLSNQIAKGNAWGREIDNDYSASTAQLIQVDSPGTTSAITYKFQAFVSENNTWYLNRSTLNGDYGMTGTTTFQALEISG